MFLAELHSPWGSFQSGNTVPGRNYTASLKMYLKLLIQIHLQRVENKKVTHSSIKCLTFTFCSKLSCDCTALQKSIHCELIRMPTDGVLPSAKAAGSYT